MDPTNIYQLPQHILDSSDGQRLIDYYAEGQRNLARRRKQNFFPTEGASDSDIAFDFSVVPEESENVGVSGPEPEVEGSSRRERTLRVNFKDNNSKPITPLKKTSEPDVLAAVRRSPNRAGASPLKSCFKLPTASKRNDLHRKSILNNIEKMPFSKAVASTPCDARRHPLNASASPIAKLSDNLKVLQPCQINNKVNQVQVLEQIVIRGANEKQDSPVSAFEKGALKIARNLSRVIRNAKPVCPESKIVHRNENFDAASTSSADSALNVTSDRSKSKEEERGSRSRESDQVHRAKEKTPKSNTDSRQTKSKEVPRKVVRSSSSSSVDSNVLDNFTEVVLTQEPMELSPGGQSLFKRAMMARKESPPKRPPRRAKVSKPINRETELYFQLNNSDQNKAPRNSGNKTKRQLYSQRFDDSLSRPNPVAEVAIKLPDSQEKVTPGTPKSNEKTSMRTIRNPKTMSISPASAASETSDEDVPLQSLRSAKETSSSTREATITSATYPKVVLPRLQDIQSQERSVQTSPLEPVTQKKRPPVKKAKTAPLPIKKKIQVALPLVESSEIVEGVRRSKRTRYYPVQGYWEKPVPIVNDKDFFKRYRVPSLERSPKKLKRLQNTKKKDSSKKETSKQKEKPRKAADEERVDEEDPLTQFNKENEPLPEIPEESERSWGSENQQHNRASKKNRPQINPETPSKRREKSKNHIDSNQESEEEGDNQVLEKKPPSHRNQKNKEKRPEKVPKKRGRPRKQRVEESNSKEANDVVTNQESEEEESLNHRAHKNKERRPENDLKTRGKSRKQRIEDSESEETIDLEDNQVLEEEPPSYRKQKNKEKTPEKAPKKGERPRKQRVEESDSEEANNVVTNQDSEKEESLNHRAHKNKERRPENDREPLETRGKSRKQRIEDSESEEAIDLEDNQVLEEEPPSYRKHKNKEKTSEKPPKKRGRPRKHRVEESDSEEASDVVIKQEMEEEEPLNHRKHKSKEKRPLKEPPEKKGKRGKQRVTESEESEEEPSNHRTGHKTKDKRPQKNQKSPEKRGKSRKQRVAESESEFSEVDLEQESSDDNQEQVDINRNAEKARESTVENRMKWVTKLLRKSLDLRAKTAVPININNSDFEQFSKSENVTATVINGITYINYREGIFQDSGYFKMAPCITKLPTNSGKYSLSFLLIVGCIKIVIDDKTYELESGDMCHVRSRQKYTLHNRSTSPTLIFYQKRKEVAA